MASRTTGKAAMDQREKVRENRLRAAALRQGLTLQKSRRRDPRALDYQGHWLKDARAKTILGGEHGTTLDAIEAYLTGGEPHAA
jgi:hypothetical protein